MSEDWQIRSVRDIADLKSGKNAPKEIRSDDGLYRLMGANGEIGRTTVPLERGPLIIVGRVGANCGEVTWVPRDEECWVTDNALIVRPKRDIDIGFLKASLELTDFAALRGGSSQPLINQATFDAVSIAIPPLPVQRRIAAVLGALDALIEANERLLHQVLGLALDVFEDRFGSRPLVHRLGDLCVVSDCLHSKKPIRQQDGQLLLQLMNIGPSGQLDVGEKYLISNEDYARWKRPLETTTWDCVITNVGRVGAVARVPADVKAALGRNMTGIRPVNPLADGAFVSQALLCKTVRREIDLLTDAGTIMNALNVRAIPDIRLPDSSAEERSAYHRLAAPLLEMADGLLVECRSLRAQRDELLPLLMSGRVSPGEVDLGV